jgi:hypothetical protein
MKKSENVNLSKGMAKVLFSFKISNQRTLNNLNMALIRKYDTREGRGLTE